MMCWKMIGLCVVAVCMCGVVLFLIELGINKFCVLSDERFLRFKLGSVMICW